EVRVDRGLRIDLDGVDETGPHLGAGLGRVDAPGLVGQLRAPDIAEVVRRVRRDQQHAPAVEGAHHRQPGGDRGLARTALAADEEESAGACDVLQHVMWYNG